MNPERVRIVVEGPDSFSEHGRIPIVFTVSGRVDLAVLVETHGATVVERACPPYVKDYDLEETERPSRYVEHFDVTDWHLVSAFSGKERVGGAVVAVRALDFRISEGRPDTAVIVDLRIAPPFQRQGIGRKVVEAATALAVAKGRARLRVETQDTNTGACRFYVATGFRVVFTDAAAYGPGCDDVLICWELEL